MKILILTYLLLLNALFLYSQEKQIDSLKAALINTKSEAQKLEILEEICAKAYVNLPKEGLHSAREILKITSSSKSNPKRYFANRYIGIYYMNSTQFDSALFYFDKNLKEYDLSKESNQAYTDLSNKGNVFRYQKKYDSAFFYLNSAKDLAEKHEFKDKYTSIYNNLASFYHYNNQSEKAVAYYIKAIDSSIHLKNERKLISLYNNIGNVFKDLDNCKKAISYLKKATSLAKKANHKQGLADASLHTAICYMNLNIKKDSTEILLKSSIQLYKEIKDNLYLLEALEAYGQFLANENRLNDAILNKKQALKLAKTANMEDKIFGTNISLADSYIKAKNFYEASTYIDFALKDTLNEKTNSFHNKLQLYKTKAFLEKRKKNFKESLKYQEMYSNTLLKYDSLINKNSINELETKYQTEKKENENLQLKADNAQQALLTQKANTQKWLFLLVAIIVLLILILYIKYAQSKKKELIYNSRLAIVKAKQSEQEEISKELHDNVTKKLESIAISLTKQGNKLLANKTTAIKNNIRKLSKELSFVSFNESPFKEQLITLAANYQSEHLKIVINGLNNIKWKHIAPPIKYNLFLIIREAVSNCYNHANATCITISMIKEHKAIAICIQDNGKGFNTKTVAYGRGFKNMTIRVKDINGSMQVKSQLNKGTLIYIQLALA